MAFYCGNCGEPFEGLVKLKVHYENCNVECSGVEKKQWRLQRMDDDIIIRVVEELCCRDIRNFMMALPEALFIKGVKRVYTEKKLEENRPKITDLTEGIYQRLGGYLGYSDVGNLMLASRDLFVNRPLRGIYFIKEHFKGESERTHVVSNLIKLFFQKSHLIIYLV